MNLRRSGCPIGIEVQENFTGLAHVVKWPLYREFTIDIEALRTGAFERPEDCGYTEQELRIATSIVAGHFATYVTRKLLNAFDDEGFLAEAQ